jgi:hypothetical protein
MDSRLPTLIAAALLAASCSPKKAEPAPEAPIPAPAPAATPAPTPPPAEPAPLPQPTPAEEAPVTPPNEAGPEAAAEVAREYFALLGAKQYAMAWNLWAGGGEASGVSKSEFADRFAKYASYNAAVGKPGGIEGAAGSAYIEIPVKVDATLKSGGAEHTSGTVTLRRVNDVPGSTDAQRHWHIQSVELK